MNGAEAVGLEGEARMFRLADGRVLGAPREMAVWSLRVGSWIGYRGAPRQVVDLRQRFGGGRLVHLAGRPPVVLAVGSRQTVEVFTVFG